MDNRGFMKTKTWFILKKKLIIIGNAIKFCVS